MAPSPTTTRRRCRGGSGCPGGAAATFSAAQVAHGCAQGRCLVVRGRRVYDLSSFVALHPGGPEVLAAAAGTDVSAALDGPPHRHSESARRWLEQYAVGHLRPTPAAAAAQNGLETSDSESPVAQTPTTNQQYKAMDANTDVVDWSKPLLWQVGHLGKKYDAWIHEPVNRPIRLFHSELMEFLSKSAWYMVCVVWIPVMLGLSWYAYTSLAQGETCLFSACTTAYSIRLHKYLFPVLFLLGMFIWTLLEYLIHRFIFHMKPPSSSYLLITLHFLLHGQHHKAPYDDTRLAFPPAPASLVVFFFYFLSQATVSEGLGLSLLAGGLCGYIIYDMVHYYLHFGSLKMGSYLQRLKSYHTKHHFQHQKAGFSITTPFWDHQFHTSIPEDSFEETN